MPLRQLQIKLQKAAEITYLQENKTRSKVSRNIFRSFEVRKKIRLMYWTPNNSIKGKCYVFSRYKQRNKMCLLYLECKLQQYRYGWCISKLRGERPVERTSVETSKQQARYCWCSSMLMSLRKAKYCVFGPFQQTSKVECMYLAFTNLQISSKKGRKWSES